MEKSSVNFEKLQHHEQQELCTTRPLYRQGKKLTAVKVYSVVSESSHLLISGVPAINLQHELRTNVAKYGDIVCMESVANLTDESFVDTFHVKYSRIQSARYAKKQLDGSSFYGGVLHVCYAPELETLSETRSKLSQRKRDVMFRLRRNAAGNNLHQEKSSIKETQDNVVETFSAHETPQSKSQNFECRDGTQKVYGPSLPVKSIHPKSWTAVDPSSLVPSVPYSSRFIPRQVHTSTSRIASNVQSSKPGDFQDSNSKEAQPSHATKRLASQDVLDVRKKIRTASATSLNLIKFKNQQN